MYLKVHGTLINIYCIQAWSQELNKQRFNLCPSRHRTGKKGFISTAQITMIIPRLAEPGSEAALLAPAVETLSSFAAITHVFVPPVDTKVLGIASEMGVSGQACATAHLRSQHLEG